MGKKVFKNYRTESRTQWGTEIEDEHPISFENIQLGCLLRIADATELMAKNYNQLLADVKWYRERNDWYKAETGKLERSNRALRGQITRLRKRITDKVTEIDS